jgi:hypothetical protein
MLLKSLLLPAIPASLLLACGHTGPTHVNAGSTPTLTARPEYVTVAPDVSISRTAEPAEQKQASIDPNADVMAEILAIPPGR